MNVFSANTTVTLAVPLTDKSGNLLAVSAISYSITDQNGAEVVALTELTDFVPESEEAVIVVPAESNAIGADTQGARLVTLQCTIGENVATVHASYGLEAADPLRAGVNSFMTYGQAQFVAMTMPNIEGWEAADERARIAALIDARTHILRLSFSTYDLTRDQSSLAYLPEGQREVSYPNLYSFAGDLSLLSPEQFNALPVRFVAALRQAQLAEANSILGGSGIDQKRREGLVQDDVGESRQVFRQSKPLELPVCRRAMGYLTGYVSFGLRIGRG